VLVDEARDVVAQVPLPNTQVQLVEEGIGIFLTWPKI